MSANEKLRIASALARILDGKNPYYKERLSDPEFVAAVKQAYESEMKELMIDGRAYCDERSMGQ